MSHMCAVITEPLWSDEVNGQFSSHKEPDYLGGILFYHLRSVLTGIKLLI